MCIGVTNIESGQWSKGPTCLVARTPWITPSDSLTPLLIITWLLLAVTTHSYLHYRPIKSSRSNLGHGDQSEAETSYQCGSYYSAKVWAIVLVHSRFPHCLFPRCQKGRPCGTIGKVQAVTQTFPMQKPTLSDWESNSERPSSSARPTGLLNVIIFYFVTLNAVTVLMSFPVPIHLMIYRHRLRFLIFLVHLHSYKFKNHNQKLVLPNRLNFSDFQTDKFHKSAPTKRPHFTVS